MKHDYTMIIEDLVTWFRKNARELPWRSNPKPYYVWVSEIMLQQTRVEAVKEYFKRFITELPDIKSLAEAPEEKLLKLWEGLGYYNRVRNLQKAAITIMEQYEGELPADYKKLLSLSGIGSYTAGAIGSIAYGIPIPAVDGNVLRVTKRISGSYDDITKASIKKELEEDLLAIMPKEKPGDFNQALMELGAMVCIPNGKPLCEKCPVRQHCIGFQKNIMMELPVKPPKKARKVEEKTVFVIEYQNKYALHKRAEKGLLAKLWELPNVESKWSIEKLEQWLEENGIEEYELELLGDAKHIFSHIEWHMLGYAIRIAEKTEAIKMQTQVKPFENKMKTIGKQSKVEELENKAEKIENQHKIKILEEQAETIEIQKQIEKENLENKSETKKEKEVQIENLDVWKDTGIIWVTREELKDTYALPTAFSAYQSKL